MTDQFDKIQKIRSKSHILIMSKVGYLDCITTHGHGLKAAKKRLKEAQFVELIMCILKEVLEENW